MEIILNSKKHGQYFLLYDEQDHHLIEKYNWILAKRGTVFYAVAKITPGRKGKLVLFHQLLNIGNMIDHRDGNGLNNQRSNIRSANKSQNAINSGIRSTNSSGYKGVIYFKWGTRQKRWLAKIMLNRKPIHGGYFNTTEEAAIRYNEMAVQYHGEFARLNIIPDTRELLAKNSIEV